MRSGVVAISLLTACGSHHEPPPPAQRDNLGEFLKRGTPTFVATADRGVLAQARFYHDLLFPQAPFVLDTEVTTPPPHALIYGGPHVNRLTAALDLPFEMSRGSLDIAGQHLTGDGIQLIAVFPDYVLFAGTGVPGVGEINAQVSDQPITIRDEIGILYTGHWDAHGQPVLDPRHARPSWRSVERGAVTFRSLTDLSDATIDAALRGVMTASDAVGAVPQPVTIYVYPDEAHEQQYTGTGGDGHAVAEAGAVHVVDRSPDAVEHLLAHEATHVLAYHTWGAAGSPLLGEGLAVWAAGGYGGVALADWPAKLPPLPPISELLVRSRQLGEAVGYPAGGLLVATLIELVGKDALRDHLFGATASTWDADCRAAGTTAETVQEAFDARLGR